MCMIYIFLFFYILIEDNSSSTLINSESQPLDYNDTNLKSQSLDYDETSLKSQLLNCSDSSEENILQG